MILIHQFITYLDVDLALLQVWRAVILEVLVILITFARDDHSARETILSTTKGLFTNIWQRRDFVRLSDPDTRHSGADIDDTTMLSTLVHAYYDTYHW